MSEDSSLDPVFRRFVRRLIAMAQAHQAESLRQNEDPDDVVQSVFKSFPSRQAGWPYGLGGWESLWGLLALLTLRKCRGRDAAAARNSFAREPTLSEAAMLVETMEGLLRALNERDRRVVVLSLQAAPSPRSARSWSAPNAPPTGCWPASRSGPKP
jgi:hypothetical protein